MPSMLSDIGGFCEFEYIDHEPGIDPATHLGGGKPDDVRWIA